MYLGRYQLGQEIPLSVRALNSSGVPTAPAAVPTINVYKSDGTKVISAKGIPIVDRYGVTGYFSYNLYLDARFATGSYAIVVSWTVSGFTGRDVLHFEVVRAGNVDGAIVSLYFYRRPHADFILQGTDGGVLTKGRNPYL